MKEASLKRLLERKKKNFPSTLLSSWPRPTYYKRQINKTKTNRDFLTCIPHAYPEKLNNSLRWLKPSSSAAKDKGKGLGVGKKKGAGRLVMGGYQQKHGKQG